MLESWQSPALIAGAVALLVVDLAVLHPRTIRGAAIVTAVWTAARFGVDATCEDRSGIAPWESSTGGSAG